MWPGGSALHSTFVSYLSFSELKGTYTVLGHSYPCFKSGEPLTLQMFWPTAPISSNPLTGRDSRNRSKHLKSQMFLTFGLRQIHTFHNSTNLTVNQGCDPQIPLANSNMLATAPSFANYSVIIKHIGQLSNYPDTGYYAMYLPLERGTYIYLYKYLHFWTLFGSLVVGGILMNSCASNIVMIYRVPGIPYCLFLKENPRKDLQYTIGTSTLLVQTPWLQTLSPQLVFSHDYTIQDW